MGGHEDIVREALDALNRHDVDAYLAFCTPDVVTISELGECRGVDELRRLLEPLDAMSQPWRKIDKLLVRGDSVGVWCTLGGTNPSTGRSVEIDGVSVFEIEGDRIRSVTEFIDYGPALAIFS